MVRHDGTSKTRQAGVWRRKILLTTAALAAAGVFIGIGAMTPRFLDAQPSADRGAGRAFEAASVRVASPQAVGLRKHSDAGRVEYRNFPLVDILADAWKIDNRLILGPSWLGPSARYDIIAKIPEGVSESQVPAMLQSLLLERFHMKVHRETKVTQVYALVTGKGGPKLERVEDAPPDGETHFLAGLRFPEMGFRFTGATMGKLLLIVETYAQDMSVVVVDRTGLQGRYNFTFQFESGPDMLPSLSAAVERLGLRLEARKEPVDYLVVDLADRVPADN